MGGVRMAVQSRRQAGLDLGVLRDRTMLALLYAFLIGWALANFLPMVWVALSALKTDVEIFEHPFALPEQWKFGNYQFAFTEGKIGRYLGNSVLFAGGSALLGLILAALCAFPFARHQFRLKGILWAFLMAMFLLPVSMRIIPLMILVIKLNLYGKMWAMILIYATGSIPFSAFFLRAYMETIPRELEEAAVMDGANMWHIFTRIIVPLSEPALATLGVFNFLAGWNEFLFVVVMARDEHTFTIPAGIATMSTKMMTQHALNAAAFTISILPVVLVFLLAQQRVVKGMTAGAVKGA
jgi:raffinose/stachyose/melibiose transport system permease protein